MGVGENRRGRPSHIPGPVVPGRAPSSSPWKGRQRQGEERDLGKTKFASRSLQLFRKEFPSLVMDHSQIPDNHKLEILPFWNHIGLIHTVRVRQS